MGGGLKSLGGKSLSEKSFLQKLQPRKSFSQKPPSAERFHQAWRPAHRKKEKAISHVGKRPRAEEMKSHQLAVGAGEVEQETQIKWEVRALLGSIWTPAPSSGRPTPASQGRGGRRSREFSQLCVHGPGSRPARRRTLGKASAGPRWVGGGADHWKVRGCVCIGHQGQ